MFFTINCNKLFTICSINSSLICIIFIIVCNFDESVISVAADHNHNTNCRTKLFNTVVKHCATDGVPARFKRNAQFGVKNSDKNRDNQETAAGSSETFADLISVPVIPPPEIARSQDQEIPVPPRGGGFTADRIPDSEDYPRFVGFPSPKSGDDLHTGITASSGMSQNEMEELCDEMIQRFPRGAKHKDQIMSMITTYAATCCNENSNDSKCNDLTNVITCP